MAGFSIRTFLDNIRSLGNPEKRGIITDLLNNSYWDVSRDGYTNSGRSVSADDSLEYPAVWAAVQLISKTIASLPFDVIERTDYGRKVVKDHPLYTLVHRAPNSFMTSFTYRQVLMLDMLLHGNGYAFIHRGADERQNRLQIISPERVSIYEVDGELFYQIDSGDMIPAYNMIHCMGLTQNGIIGMSPITYARESIAAGLTAQEYSGELMANGITATGIIEMDGIPKDDQLEDLKKQMGQQFSGSRKTNKYGIAIMYGGMKFNRIAIPPVDAQFMEQRKFSVSDVGRIFNTPPHLIGDVEKSTSWGTGIEQQNIGFHQYTLLPWMKVIEQEHDRKLFAFDEKGRIGTKLNADGLLRGDVKTRTAYYQSMKLSGNLSTNEIRAFENLEPREGHDELMYPVNSTTLENIKSDEE